MKIDQRKRASDEVIAKRAAAGKADRPAGAFVPRQTKKVDRLQERIELVVAMAKDAEKLLGQDVIRHNRHPLLLSRIQAHKIA